MPMTYSSDTEHRWLTLKQRFQMPNPDIVSIAERMYDHHFQKQSKFQDLNPELQRHYYRIVEATMRALGVL